VFDFIPSSEKTLSDLLASLLDPCGSHGQRHIFLKLFLLHSKLGIDPGTINERAEIIREYPTEGGRLIDIIIKLDDGLIVGIENKPFTEEADKQVKDYVEFLERLVQEGRFKGFGFVFLDKIGSNPTPFEDAQKLKSLIDDQKFAIMSYRRNNEVNLKSWVRQCYEKCESERLRYFLSDFIGYLERQFREGDNGAG
jgi:hypothetical protein